MKSQSYRYSALSLAAACGLAASSARAADPSTAPAAQPTAAPTAVPAPVTPPVSAYTFTADGGATYAFDADLRGGGGSFSVFRSDSSIAMDHPFSGGNDLRVSFSGEYDHYFFRNFGPVPGDDGSDALDVYQFALRPMLTHVFSPNLTFYGGFQITASGQSQAHFDDALSYGAFVGFTYKFSPTVSVGAGLGVSTQLEDDPFFFPLLTLDWKIAPDWTLSANGPGVKLTYQINDAWSVFASARYDFRQFRMAGDEIVRDGVLSDQSVPVTIGVTCMPLERLTISGELGVVAYRRLEVTDSVGHQVGADEADPAAFAGIRVQYTF